MLGFWIAHAIRTLQRQAASDDGSLQPELRDVTAILVTLCVVSRNEMWVDGLDLFAQLRQASRVADPSNRIDALRRAESLLIHMPLCSERRAAARLGRWLARRSLLVHRWHASQQQAARESHAHVVPRWLFEAVAGKSLAGEYVSIGDRDGDATAERILLDGLLSAAGHPNHLMEK
ncbi:hypothetical protein D8B25_20030 [Verminephrobacter aporrectodeae subsp. tuberculatae]|nr:hypothetical protein [Verminephrobacter aporrectodeae subsp. tuberculatae]MCW8169153.1 hypothetical protein [Verminephrobacter aporrectodeae subsp. tuberculatae]MCW8177570.1 hypothetical protein [Verminephrobacter aporrectodeae subsp. tuberculatae]MCW8205005.1 hypothetical protein [Verminephrobacter aporrectodeae subsp. tuberculatae]